MCHFLPAPTVSDEKSSVLHQKKHGDGGRVQQRSIKTSMGLMDRKMGVIMQTGKDGEAWCAGSPWGPKESDTTERLNNNNNGDKEGSGRTHPETKHPAAFVRCLLPSKLL